MSLEKFVAVLRRDSGLGEEKLEAALCRRAQKGGNLDLILLEMGYADELAILRYLSLSYGMPAVGKSEIDNVAPEVARQRTTRQACLKP